MNLFCEMIMVIFKLFFQLSGKPFPTNTKSNSMKICWDKPRKKVDSFQVRYKPKNGESKWKLIETSQDSNYTTITKLMPDTEYIFQVRGVFGDLEGPYGPVSDSIVTLKSPTTDILKSCKYTTQEKSPKLLYHLPLRENIRARNEKARTKKMILG